MNQNSSFYPDVKNFQLVFYQGHPLPEEFNISWLEGSTDKVFLSNRMVSVYCTGVNRSFLPEIYHLVGKCHLEQVLLVELHNELQIIVDIIVLVQLKNADTTEILCEKAIRNMFNLTTEHFLSLCTCWIRTCVRKINQYIYLSCFWWYSNITR